MLCTKRGAKEQKLRSDLRRCYIRKSERVFSEAGVNMDYVQSLRKVVGTRPLILVGSVVIVLNDKNEMLLQQRPDEEWGRQAGCSTWEKALRKRREEK